jgi:predicted regulator of Ras-like GTPase activity (Roadblock/LC7/MglB family)
MSTETAENEAAAAADAIAELLEESSGIRACAVLGEDGSVLAESSANDWATAVAELWSAAAEGGAEPTQVHVATEDGEVYAVRVGGVTAAAVTDRFTLASLMFCDLRSALRKLGGASS